MRSRPRSTFSFPIGPRRARRGQGMPKRETRTGSLRGPNVRPRPSQSPAKSQGGFACKETTTGRKAWLAIGSARGRLCAQEGWMELKHKGPRGAATPATRHGRQPRSNGGGATSPNFSHKGDREAAHLASLVAPYRHARLSAVKHNPVPIADEPSRLTAPSFPFRM